MLSPPIGDEFSPLRITERSNLDAQFQIDASRDRVHAAAPDARPAKNAIDMTFARETGFLRGLHGRELCGRTAGDVDATSQEKNRDENGKKAGEIHRRCDCPKRSGETN